MAFHTLVSTYSGVPVLPVLFTAGSFLLAFSRIENEKSARLERRTRFQFSRLQDRPGAQAVPTSTKELLPATCHLLAPGRASPLLCL